jgi:Uma2 family endonuclease
MTPERAAHAEVKLAVQTALANALRAGRIPCRVLPDGMTVRIDDSTAHEPDALVYCGPRLAPSALEVPNPVIVVEVLSPTTRHVDATIKLAGYFRLPSIMHYLIIDPDKPLVLHHARNADGTILTRIATEGNILLDPPGVEIAVADIYSAT